MGNPMTESADTLVEPPLSSSLVRDAAQLGMRAESILAAAGLPPITNKGQPIEDGNVCVDNAFAIILQCDLERVLASCPLAESGKDPEGVHQLRVALRRLRGSLALLGGLAPSVEIDAFRGEVKWLASGLGDARAWDVFLSETLTEVEQGCPGVKGFKELRDIAEACRVRSYDRVRKLLVSRRCGRIQLDLASWIAQRGWRDGADQEQTAALSTPFEDFARAALTRQHARVLRRGRHFARLSPAERHRLRLAAKRLRYATDLLLPALDRHKAAERYVRSLTRLQDALGRDSDISATPSLLTPLSSDPSAAAACQAIGAVLGWQARCRPDVERGMRPAWRRFRAEAVPGSRR